MKKRLTALFVSVCFTVFSVLLPYRVAMAAGTFETLLTMEVRGGLAATAVAVTRGNPLVNAVLTVGGAAIIGFAGDYLASKIEIHPKDVVPPYYPGPSSTPPATVAVPSGVTVTGVCTGSYGSPAAALACAQAQFPNNQTGCIAASGLTAGASAYGCAGWLNILPAPCPSGYSASGSSCNLSDASKVPYSVDWSKYPVIQTAADGQSFVADAKAPVPVPAAVTPKLSAPLVLSGHDDQNNPMQITVTPNTGGGFTVKTNTQLTDSNGSTFTKQDWAKVGPDGKIQDYGSVTQTGSIASPGVQNNTTINNSGAAVVFPTDYARQSDITANTAEQAKLTADSAAAVAEQSAQDAKWAALVSTAKSQQLDSEAKVSAAAVAVGLPGGFGGFNGLNPPTANSYNVMDLIGFYSKLPSGGGCETWQGTIFNRSFTLDPCPVVNKVKPYLDWAVATLGILAGLSELLKREEG